MHRVTTFAAALVAGALTLTACGGSSGGDTGTKPSGSTSKTAKALKVGMAYDIGGRGDQSFNDAAAAGLDKAKAELGIDPKEAEATNGEAESAKEECLRALAGAGYNPVIAVGFRLAIVPPWPRWPCTCLTSTSRSSMTRWAVGPNITNLLFAENEGSFLVGAAAALKSKGGQRRLRVGGASTYPRSGWQRSRPGYASRVHAVVSPRRQGPV